MTEHNTERPKVRNFSIAFEQMCNFVAITKTRDYNETLQQLILQCFIILPDEHFYDARQIKETIDTLFGLQIPEHQTQSAIDTLKDKGIIQQPANTNYTLEAEVRNGLQKQVDNAISLEEKVKYEWFAELLNSAPDLPVEQAWKALKGYLARAFRRHGIQTAALLDPSIDVAPEYSESLTFLLTDILNDVFPKEQHVVAKKVISDFLASVGKHPDRATYIGQLADGAFNYFSLTVAPDVAEKFREKLSPLTLFLDTNFLFGILDLHVSAHVAVSNELLKSIEKYKLPFKLRYHQATEKEMLSTIDYYSFVLRERYWSQALSRAAVKSKNISGIELKYHQLNAETGIDVEIFLKPYKHVDILLKDKNISIYQKEEDRTNEITDLILEYQEFLESKKKPKPYEALAHDIKLLDTVRRMRSNAKSSLEAGALLITCDYLFYRFDWENSRKCGSKACTVLPNMFWQVLRPYIPSNLDFDRSFAETFAIPEFRTISSGAAKACSKMLSLLAAYKDIPEETAARLLSNDLLIDQLRTAQDDKQFQEYVESAIAKDNALLLEEKAALVKQLEQERAEKKAKDEVIEKERILYEQQRAKAEQILTENKKELESTKKLLENEKIRLTYEITKEKRAKEEAETRVRKEAPDKANLEKSANIYATMAASAISLVLIGIFEILIHQISWQWLLQHQNSYGLQGAFDILLALTMFGIFRPKWRKWCWGGGLFAILLIILQLLGGPKK